MTETAKFKRLCARVARLERFMFPVKPKPPLRDPTPSYTEARAAAIMERVAMLWCVSVEALSLADRHAKLVEPRHVAMYCIYWRCNNVTQERVSAMFKCKHHTTVTYALKAVQDRIDSDKRFAARVQDVMDWAVKMEEQPTRPATGGGSAATPELQ